MGVESPEGGATRIMGSRNGWGTAEQGVSSTGPSTR